MTGVHVPAQDEMPEPRRGGEGLQVACASLTHTLDATSPAACEAMRTWRGLWASGGGSKVVAKDADWACWAQWVTAVAGNHSAAGPRGPPVPLACSTSEKPSAERLAQVVAATGGADVVTTSPWSAPSGMAALTKRSLMRWTDLLFRPTPAVLTPVAAFLRSRGLWPDSDGARRSRYLVALHIRTGGDQRTWQDAKFLPRGSDALADVSIPDRLAAWTAYCALQTSHWLQRTHGPRPRVTWLLASDDESFGPLLERYVRAYLEVVGDDPAAVEAGVRVGAPREARAPPAPVPGAPKPSPPPVPPPIEFRASVPLACNMSVGLDKLLITVGAECDVPASTPAYDLHVVDVRSASPEGTPTIHLERSHADLVKAGLARVVMENLFLSLGHAMVKTYSGYSWMAAAAGGTPYVVKTVRHHLYRETMRYAMCANIGDVRVEPDEFTTGYYGDSISINPQHEYFTWTVDDEAHDKLRKAQGRPLAPIV
jgi:hypothetical protein